MSQTSLQRCYANSRAQINIFELKHKTLKPMSMQLYLFWKYCLLLSSQNLVTC